MSEDLKKRLIASSDLYAAALTFQCPEGVEALSKALELPADGFQMEELHRAFKQIAADCFARAVAEWAMEPKEPVPPLVVRLEAVQGGMTMQIVGPLEEIVGGDEGLKADEAAILDALVAGEVYRGGGGAEAEFTITLVEPEA